LFRGIFARQKEVDMKNVCAWVVLLVLSGVATVTAQTNASKASGVGTWKLDVPHSQFGTEPTPKSMTLTILEDTPERSSWRVDVVDEKDKPFSYSWNGPVDGTMQSVKGADGSELFKESLKKDGNALLRHGQDPTDGSSFDSRATMSDDGTTITDVITSKTKDGKTSKMTAVFLRVSGAR
jgi:hypothetical protein